MGAETLTRNTAGTIAVTFPYRPDLVTKVKSIPGHRWNRENKSWSFFHTDEIIEKILKFFERKVNALVCLLLNSWDAKHTRCNYYQIS